MAEQKNNRFSNYANFFKGYMNLSTVVVAALPIPLASFAFYSRYRLAWWMFHNELNGKPIGFSRPIKTIMRYLPFFFITLSLCSILSYHHALQASVNQIKNSIINTNNQKENIEPSLKYFGKYIEVNKGFSFSLDSQYILTNADALVIPYNRKLLISYLGIFLSAQTAFVLMSLREYLQDILTKEKLFKYLNPENTNRDFRDKITDQDCSAIYDFVKDADAKWARDYYEDQIINILPEIKSYKQKNHTDENNSNNKPKKCFSPFIKSLWYRISLNPRVWISHLSTKSEIIRQDVNEAIAIYRNSNIRDNTTIKDLVKYLREQAIAFGELNEDQQQEANNDLADKIMGKFNIRVKNVIIDNNNLVVEIMDGRTIKAPLAQYNSLSNATLEQLKKFVICGDGYDIYWQEIDEDISIERLLRNEHQIIT